MKKVTKKTIRAWLRDVPVPQPPEDLAGKIKKEVPENLSFGKRQIDILQGGRFHFWPGWGLAACAVLLIAGTFIGIMISQRFLVGVHQLPRQASPSPQISDLKAPPRPVLEQKPLDLQRSNAGAFIPAAREPRSSFNLTVRPTSYDHLKDQIEDGKIPPQELIRSEDIINHFRLQDLPAQKNDFVIWTVGGLSPFTSDSSFKMLKIDIKAPDPLPESRNELRIAKDTHLEIEFNPRIVDVYRPIGIEEKNRKEALSFVKGKDVRAREALTALYELKLKQDPEPDDQVAMLTLKYVLAHNEEPGVKKIHTIKVPVLATNLRKQTADLEFTALVAQYAQMLKDVQKAQEKDFRSILDRARSISVEIPRKDDLGEFIRLVEATEKIKIARSTEPEMDSLDTEQE